MSVGNIVFPFLFCVQWLLIDQREAENKVMVNINMWILSLVLVTNTEPTASDITWIIAHNRPPSQDN